MSERWTVIQGAHTWATLPTQIVDPENYLAGITYFTVKENPTQVTESRNKPVNTVTTINGKEIDVKPCAPPGVPLPTNPKMNITIEHLQAEDYYRFMALDKYDVDFYMETVNYRPTPLRGRRLHLRILRIEVTWVGLRFDEQVYNISMTCRKLD